MKAFRLLLTVQVTGLLVYTGMVGNTHGWSLLPVFLNDIAAMSWPGQFNLDFTMFLSLSGLWLAWRNHFSVGGFVLGVVGFFGGMLFLAPYLLFVSFQEKGDIRAVLLGGKRAAAR